MRRWAWVLVAGMYAGGGWAQAAGDAGLGAALAGRWVGVLEYRDYSEPAGSAKRVKLPTWLTVAADGPRLRWHYVYDDGPGKTVTEDEAVTVDAAARSYRVEGEKGPARVFAVSGLEALKEGRGTLTLTGTVEENGKPVPARTTLTVRRNLLEVTRETGEPLAFRDGYVLVRAEPPGAGR